MSFEERFASMGRALDDAFYAVRSRSRRSPRPARKRSMRSAISSGVSRALERSREAVEDARSHLRGESRRRIAITLLVVLSIATTAMITWQLAGGRGGTVGGAYWEDVHAVAARRDHVNVTAPISPEPIRAGNKAGR